MSQAIIIIIIIIIIVCEILGSHGNGYAEYHHLRHYTMQSDRRLLTLQRKLVSPYLPALKKKAVHSYEKLIGFYQTVWCHG
jgi:hypothetical protein